MSPAPPTISPALAERLKHQAQAKILERQRAGTWSGGVVAHSAWQKDPLGWIVKHLEVPEHTLRWSLNPGYEGKHVWDGDKDPLVRALSALADWQNCCIESATGTGKTYLAACVVLWFLAAHENALVITSAPKAENLLGQIWREVGTLWSRFHRHFPQAELLTGRIRMKPGEGEKESWTAMAFVAGVGADEDAAQKAAGFHREHMLIITEDTPGIDGAIMAAFAHTRTDDHNLAMCLGNPDHIHDSLHRFGFDEQERPRPGIVTLRISALDHPNIVVGRAVVPGAIGPRRLAERTEEFGKGTRLYESRIRGICPKEPEEALVRWDWCVAAAARWADPDLRRGAPALGVDVADSPTGDKAAIAKWQGACCTEVEAFNVRTDAEEVAERVYLLATDPENPVSPRHIGLDSVGVGASAYNALVRKGLRVRKISSGSRAIPQLDTETRWSETSENEEGRTRPSGPVVVESELYGSQRDQVMWRMREDLRMGRVAIPHDEELWRDLCTPSYTTRNGKIFVESKEAIMARLKRSPDKGDACCYGNFVRRRMPLRAPETGTGMAPIKNRDQGLERFMAAHAKRQKAEEARFKRAFARRAGGRREA